MIDLKNKTKGKLLNWIQRHIIFSNSLAVLFYVLLFSCNPIVKTLGPFSSPSVEESKKRGVFLWEYYPVSTMIYDTIDLNISEVFAEKQYKYISYKDLRYKISEDKFQIILVSKNNLFDLKYSETWTSVSWGLDNFYSRSAHNLVSEYNRIPPDSIIIKVLRLETDTSGRSGKNDKKLIRSIVIHRK